MDITVYQSFLPHHDPEASLACYRDTLGFEVRRGVRRDALDHGRSPDQPGTSIVLHPPGAGTPASPTTNDASSPR
jgi:hypothetical protein